jgi:hypothetical protein
MRIMVAMGLEKTQRPQKIFRKILHRVTRRTHREIQEEYMSKTKIT